MLEIISNTYPFYIEKHTIPNDENEDMQNKILFKWLHKIFTSLTSSIQIVIRNTQTISEIKIIMVLKVQGHKFRKMKII